MLELNFVLNSTGGRLVSDAGSIDFSGVSTDSRNISKGEIFFALKGENFDGHAYVDEAFTRGAAAAVIEKDGMTRVNGKPIIRVSSTLKALGDLASEWRKSFPELKLAAITGSNGKTTTKEMAWTMVSLKYSTLKNSGNFNNLIGLPLTLFSLDESYKAAVVELGMNDFGEIRRLSEIASPDIGAITNIGRAHLEKLGGIDGVAEAKGELVEAFGGNQTFVVNADDPRVSKIADGINCKKISFGIKSEGASLSASDIEEVGFTGITFNMNSDDKSFPVRLKGIGLHNVMNALCAAGIARSFGCGPDEIRQGLENFTPAKMRLEILESPLGLRIINDTYNANPESMRSAVDELMRLKGGGKAVAVLGDMLELGGAGEGEHARLGEYISASGVDYLVTYGNYGGFILKGAGGKVHGSHAKTHDEAAGMLREIAKPGDLVLIKGSRGMKMEEITKKLL
jgi:UDP-N-acetylmuramoyl-tripeptide--D-alanyl-D-alanine ligase